MKADFNSSSFPMWMKLFAFQYSLKKPSHSCSRATGTKGYWIWRCIMVWNLRVGRDGSRYMFRVLNLLWIQGPWRAEEGMDKCLFKGLLSILLQIFFFIGEVYIGIAGIWSCKQNQSMRIFHFTYIICFSHRCRAWDICLGSTSRTVWWSDRT